MEKDYVDSDESSDADFRPDEVAGGESAMSEEESNGGSGNEEDHEGGDESSKQNVRKSKKLTKKVSRKKRSKKDDDDDDEDSDDNTTEENDEELVRRCTRQTDGALTNGRGKVIEKDHLESDEEDKSRTNALWADFLKDVKPTAVATSKETKTNGSSTNQETASSSKNVGDEPTKVAETNKSPKEETKKVTVTQILDFAGEEVRVEKEVDASSIKENKAAATAAPKMQPFGRIMPGAGIKRPAGSGSSGGLGSLLNQIGKKKKISVLEKSQMDWKSFKSSEGIEEDLQTFNKGKDGYALSSERIYIN